MKFCHLWEVVAAGKKENKSYHHITFAASLYKLDGQYSSVKLNMKVVLAKGPVVLNCLYDVRA